jgi:hypothetical protein
MLHTLHQAFQDAVRNFKEALEEPDVGPSGGGSGPRVTSATRVAIGTQTALMRLQATLQALEEQLRDVREALARERQALLDCERRCTLAAQVSDTGTVEVARRFAERHRTYSSLLAEKEDLLRRELLYHRQDLEALLLAEGRRVGRSAAPLRERAGHDVGPRR